MSVVFAGRHNQQPGFNQLGKGVIGQIADAVFRTERLGLHNVRVFRTDQHAKYHRMSTEVPDRDLVPMTPDLMTDSPVASLWNWHLANGLEFLPGDALATCWCHKFIAAALLHKSHLSKKRLDNSLFDGVGRHAHDANLVLYGDLQKARKRNEETPPTLTDSVHPFHSGAKARNAGSCVTA